MANRISGRKLREFAYFPDSSSFKQKLSVLAGKAEPELWDYQSSNTDSSNIEALPSDPQDNSEQEFPILENYLQYTFQRLDEEGKVIYNTEDEDTAEDACFNTGLISRTSGQPLIGVFKVHENYDRNPQNFMKWHLTGFFERTDNQFTNVFKEIPKVARYVNFNNVNDFANYVYNPDLDIQIPNPEYYFELHISGKNLSRCPQEFQKLGQRYKRLVFENSLEELRRFAGQSNRIALPQWRPKQRQLQILLPLNLDPDKHLGELDNKSIVAIPIQTQGNSYIVKTVLPIQKAYSNARLLSKFTTNWLHPINFDHKNNEEDYDE